MQSPSDTQIRHSLDFLFSRAEVALYCILGALLFAAALATVASAAKLLWENLHHWNIAAQTLQVLNELLVVLMMVEILHTVRVSIRSHILVTEPFLVVGLIATIRRILLVGLEMATLTRDGAWIQQGEGIFRSSVIELGLLAILVLVFVFSITLLRRYALTAAELKVDASTAP